MEIKLCKDCCHFYDGVSSFYCKRNAIKRESVNYVSGYVFEYYDDLLDCKQERDPDKYFLRNSEKEYCEKEGNFYIQQQEEQVEKTFFEKLKWWKK